MTHTLCRGCPPPPSRSIFGSKYMYISGTSVLFVLYAELEAESGRMDIGTYFRGGGGGGGHTFTS